jgi:hypothetical protein
VLVDGRKVMEGAYPSRDQLARWATPAAPAPVAVATADADGATSCGCGDGGCC